MWTKHEIENHQEAAKRLEKILSEIIYFIKQEKNTSEYDIQTKILEKYKNFNLRTHLRPIVAFDKNTACIHYFPEKKSLKLKKNTLIMVDIWGGLKMPQSPFADITWMLYFGDEIPPAIKKTFDLVAAARDNAILVLKRNLENRIILKGCEIDKIARDQICLTDIKFNYKHGTGHPLGFHNAHGRGRRINSRGRKAIHQNVAYTIEPGIYLKGKYGIRSEIDFYINEKYKLVITTPIQKSITLIKSNS